MVHFDKVTKCYQRTRALDHVTLDLKENKIYCLLGRNGAGKTTLLKLIAGHINASDGKVEVDGKRVSTLNMPECVNFIESRATQFNVKVERLLQTAKELDDDFDVGFAQKMLQKFQLDKKKKYNQLSFGMQTMLTTLISLACNDDVIEKSAPIEISFFRVKVHYFLKIDRWYKNRCKNSGTICVIARINNSAGNVYPRHNQY
ncbi:MAG TPA: ATP-binding cassette domain-containing protein [Oscillospiraceae bacterium]|nr:ATP-binding cassette domain-containing protein [Oscillospiraceae bacterium]